MTEANKDRAKTIVAGLRQFNWTVVEGQIAEALQQAIETEREACARIADEVIQEALSLIGQCDGNDLNKEYERGKGLCATRIAHKIRQRER